MNPKAFEARFLAFRQQFPGAVLLWDCGAFFELYFDDAKSCADLIGRKAFEMNPGESPSIPMVGFLRNQVRQHIAAIVATGRQVVCLNRENVAVYPGAFVILGGDVFDNSRARVFTNSDTNKAAAMALELSAKMMTGGTSYEAAPAD